ncbi:MAG: sigma-54-dependent Fis family transcriptional regulator [Planctomycetes bacterium]|nr:sigma-54-dependent Fis family transcriptional regulator [Planctomycetota bacterium]
MTTTTRVREQPPILVVEDDPEVGRLLSRELARYGRPVHVATDLEAAREALGRQAPAAVLLDARLPDGDGLDLLGEIRARDLHLRVAVLTAYADVDLAVRAMRGGASEFLEKPFTAEQLHELVRGLLQQEEGAARPERRRRPGPGAFFIGESPALQEAWRLVRLAAQAPTTTVLVTGESGTGKELAARAVHEHSGRAGGPFVAINCAALTDSLLEAELFGYERGAFTGAASVGKKGLFEVAAGGTMFLDEIGEMAMPLQAKLLRVLQERTIKRVGGLSELPVDVRIVASTNRDLEVEVAEGRFRKDLYYRLNVLNVVMPPLRDRGADVELLAQHFLKTLSLELGRTLDGFAPEALDLMRAYAWPGNVRELRNVVEHAAIVARGPRIEPGDLGLATGGRPRAPTGIVIELPDLRLETMERALIRRALEAASGQKTRAAELLGINRATLYNKLKAYGIATEVRAEAVEV